MKKFILLLIFIFCNSIFGQYIQNITITQLNTAEINVHLNTFGATHTEYISNNVTIADNIINLKVCFLYTDLGSVSYLENDFIVTIPNNSSYTLNVELFKSEVPNTCDYLTMTDNATLNFNFPLSGTVTLATNSFSNNSLPFFPNPTTGALFINESLNNSLYKIYDQFGRKINISNTILNGKINLDFLENGIYLIEFDLDNKKIIKKIILNK